jgi:cephalosporin hydroxylase
VTRLGFLRARARDRITWIDSPSDAELRDTTECGLGVSWGARFRLGDIEFLCGYEDSKSRFFPILKDPVMVEEYLEIVERFRGDNVVELGIASGGSVALTALAAPPRKLVAIDLDPDRVEPLDELIAERGIGERVRLYHGVDQADRARLAKIAEDEFGDEPLGLVIDDASHLLPETRASFETLFPRLRPGGLFVIEDWNHEHLYSRGLAAALADPNPELEAGIVRRLAEGPQLDPPFAQLVVELILIQGESHEFVRKLEINPRWVGVYRGNGELAPSEFRLADFISNDFGLLPPDWRAHDS